LDLSVDDDILLLLLSSPLRSTNTILLFLVRKAPQTRQLSAPEPPPTKPKPN
jgi:hypothetical protein